jgi:flagellar hook-associated protein 1 FlgK
MSDLFASLNSAARALDAQRLGLDVVGQNIANINSPGYTRRALTLSPIPPNTKFSAGGGVTVTDIHAQRDLLIERRLRSEISLERREAALADALGVVELSLGKAGESLDADLASFFDAFATLSEEPTSAVARNQVQDEAAALASSFGNVASGLERAGREADMQIGSVVEEINNLVARIRALNQTIASSTPEARLAPQDDQALLVRQLSALADVTALERADGGIDISIGNGRPLVIGATSYEIGKVTTGPSGYYDLSAGNFALNGEITGGKLGALLEVRDQIIPGYVAQLDALAFEVATQVNTLHATVYDQAGNAGGDFFSFSFALTGSAGAAAALRLDPAIRADGSLIAASGTTEVGGNTVARGIAALRDARVLGGGTATFNDAWGQLVYRVGRDVSNAVAEQSSRSDIVNQVESLRDQVSGISLDEEAAMMLRFQRAYEANARFFRVIDETLEMLLQLG